MADSGTFTKGGRTWVYETSPTGNTKGIYYETNLQEATRVKDKFGEQFTGNKDGKYYVLVSGYEKQPNGTWRYGPYPPGTETANGNATQVQTIGADTGLKQQITETQSPNTSPGPSNPDQQGGSTPTSEPSSTPIQPKGRGEPVTPGSGLRYPADMSAQQDKIKFYAVEIVPGGVTGEPKYSIKDGPIFLGIQGSISDQNSVDWGPDTVNAIDAKIYEKSLGLIQKGNFTETIQGTAKEVLGFGLGNTALIQKFLAGQAASINNILARTDNIILNPNLELLFQGPQLRPFSFQFKMSARDEAEAASIKKIINFFKKNMAVRGKNELFLKAPYVFTIQYLRGAEQQHPSINKISKSNDEKACALTNCSVDYTPLGSYMTYDDPSGTMVSYTLSLQFQEITPIYQEDYDGHPIGY